MFQLLIQEIPQKIAIPLPLTVFASKQQSG